MLVPITPDKGRCGPQHGEMICGYLPIKREGSDPSQFTCWNQPMQFHCVGCQREDRLTCRLLLPAEIKLGQPVPLKISLYNVSKAPVQVDPDMPLTHGTFDLSTFHVHCDGHDQPWTGGSCLMGSGGGTRDVSRYVVIPPGGAIENEIDIGKLFPWMRGSCMVHWHGMLWDVIDPAHPPDPGVHQNRVVVTCNWAITRIDP